MNEPEREKLLSQPFHAVNAVIGGHTMRPLSLATYDVLLRTENPLVKGQTPLDDTPEYTSSIIGFAYIHCAPWPDVVRASFDPQRFREDALIFCGDFTPMDFNIAIKRLQEQSRELEAAKVETMEGASGKKPLPATNPDS